MYSFVADLSTKNFPHCPKLTNAREIPLGISAAMNLYILLCAGFFIQPGLCKIALSKAMIACELFFPIPAIALRLWVGR